MEVSSIEMIFIPRHPPSDMNRHMETRHITIVPASVIAVPIEVIREPNHFPPWIVAVEGYGPILAVIDEPCNDQEMVS
jgi:hypothetical protein